MVDFWSKIEIPITWHPKSTTMTWFCTDTEESFKQKNNCVFVPDSFDYTFNRLGYRIGSADWQLDTTRPRMLTLGCSHTVGVGVPWASSWPSLLASELDHELFNLAVTGGSADTVFRTLYHSVDTIKPDTVVIMWPDSNRWELYESVKWDGTGAECDIPHFNSVWNMTAEQVNESHNRNIFIRNVALVKLLQRLHGFKLLEINSEDIFTEYLKNNNMKDPVSFDSRDPVHPGLTMHKYIKNKFIDIYSNS